MRVYTALKEDALRCVSSIIPRGAECGCGPRVHVINIIGVEGHSWSLHLWPMDNCNEAEPSLCVGTDEMVPPPPKKTKYKSKFQSEWEKEFAGITTYSQDCHRAYCRYCQTNFSVAHGGRHDVVKHVGTPTHSRARDDAKRSGRQARLFELRQGEKCASMDLKVAKAEALWSKFVVEHNLPFSVSDCFSDLVQTMFSDSAIAAKFSCKRTKTAAIVTEALAPNELECTVKYAKAGPIALMVDESNDIHNDKGCAIVLRLINTDLTCVQNRFLDMPVCNRATGANLFDVIDASMRKYGIPWENIKGFSSDNASVMVGRKNSVLSRVREATKHRVFDFGCISHVANLCAVALVKCLSEPVEDLLVDTYFWFDKSSCRKEDFHDFQDFTDTPHEVITKHVSTRWLSLEKSVNRILSQWDALQSYFSSIKEAERSGRAKRCKERYCSQSMKLYFKFLGYALARLNTFNLLFQHEGCAIYHLLDETKSLLRTYLSRFVDSEVLHTSNDLLTIDFEDTTLQVDNSALDVGTAARRYISSIEEECEPATLKHFYEDVRHSYVAVVKKLLERFPFDSEVLKCLVLLDPNQRSSTNDKDVMFLIDRFLPDLNDSEIDLILEEWRTYTLSMDLPAFGDGCQVDQWWLRVLGLKSPSGSLLFSSLGKLIRILLVLPCDQAPVERVFSMVNKIHTKYRPSMQNNTVCALLTCKVNSKVPCPQTEVSNELAKQVKAATMRRNSYFKEHNSA